MKMFAGYSSEITERRARVFRAGDLEIALFKLSDGSLKAIENRCPHKNGKLADGMVCDHHVFCPLHDWKIDLNDGLVQKPDEGCVTVFKTEVDDEDRVFIHLGAVQSKVS